MSTQTEKKKIAILDDLGKILGYTEITEERIKEFGFKELENFLRDEFSILESEFSNLVSELEKLNS